MVSIAYLKKTYQYPNWGIVEVEKVHSSRYGCHEVRAKRRKPTPADMEKINERHRVRKLERKILANYTVDDCHTTLTYKKHARPIPEEAKKALKSFLRRLRNQYRKVGYELRYIEVTEYLNSAIHHHMILNMIPDGQKIIRRLWEENGHVNFTPLNSNGDVKTLAAYFIKETKKRRKLEGQNKQNYSCSRNLVTPKPKIEVVSAKTFRQEPKIGKGHRLIKDSVENRINQAGYPYQRYCIQAIPKGPVRNAKNQRQNR